MLARASSDAGTRLRRSKSTSTVYRPAPPLVEPLDPDIAKQHAVAAATAAFVRSHAQEALGRKANRSVELGRSRSTTSHKSLTSQGSHFPPKELSVRSVPAQKSIQTSRSHLLSTTTVTEKFPSFDPAPNSEKATRPLSAQPSLTFSEYGRPASQPKSHRQSAASSITSQQIRKARSMYYASSVQTGSPIARLPTRYLTTPPTVSTSPAISAAPLAYVPTRSTGPSPLAGPRVTVPVAPDETIDTARDKYLQDFHQKRPIKHKPSLFLAPFKKRQDKSKAKARRFSSIGTDNLSTNHSFADDTVANITVSDFMPQADIKDRRSFSGSLKRKIKRVFRRSSAKSPSLPVQQIEASREYFNNGAVQLAVNHGDIPSPEEHLLRRVQSRTPPLNGTHAHPTIAASRSSSRGSARSNRSLHSEANVSYGSPSRVTSWGTSTSGETLTQRAIKRLTVIHEAKDSVGSMTDSHLPVSTKRKSLPLPTLSAFQDPMHMESLVEEASTPAIDPKRVFSALMREIGASKVAETSTDQTHTPGAESDVFESSRTKEMHGSRERPLSSANRDSELLNCNEQHLVTHRPASVAARSIQSKKSSIKSFGQVIRSTIRTVTPGEHQSSSYFDERVALQSETATPSSGTSSESRGNSESRVALFKRLRIPKKKSATLNRDTSVDTATPTATQIEMRVAKAKNRWQTPLNDSLTPQFPRETDRLYTVVNLLQPRSSDLTTDTAGQSPSPGSPPVQLPKAMETPMSPSVYSRNTDGVSILPNDSVMSFGSPYESGRTHQGGSAVILTSQSVRSYVLGTPSPKRPSSTRSSHDWRAWLSHEVSGIEAASHEDITIHQQYATPAGKHERAMAQTVRTSQTGSDDTTVIIRESFETSTPRGGSGNTAALGLLPQVLKSINSETCLHHAETVPEYVSTVAAESRKSPSDEPSVEDTLSRALVSTPITFRDCTISTPSRSSGPAQLPLGTPTSARMNERFPFLNTGRRSSSNNSSRSHLSKSPTSSVGSSSRIHKAASRPQTIYSAIPTPVASSSSMDAPGSGLRRADRGQKNKENVTPPSNASLKTPNISPLGLVQRPKSLQPLSCADLKSDPINTTQSSSNVSNASQLKKRAPSPAEMVVARPGLRVTIRALSPEKLSRRPRSAFDLRQTPSPRPASELRRPAVQLIACPRLVPGEEQSGTVEEGQGNDLRNASQRDGSVTPGQRMAERFLKERKSATVLERGIRKSTGKFIREDTPAFL